MEEEVYGVETRFCINHMKFMQNRGHVLGLTERKALRFR